MRTLKLALLLLTLVISNQASAVKQPNHSELIGKSIFSYLFWDVYEISLYANKQTFSFDNPFTLNLTYLRDFKGSDIAKRSIGEMKGLGLKNKSQVKKWHKDMEDLFPDVTKGDTLTGVYIPQVTSYFFKNGQFIGEIKSPEFGRWFFGIWLAPQTSEPKLRKKLLGDSNA